VAQPAPPPGTSAGSCRSLADAELPPGFLDRLNRIEDLLGVLQAQMIEVRERVGLPWQTAAPDELPEEGEALP
jgi:hypothetical protein